MATLNQIIKTQNDFATAHLQINSFFFGEMYDFASSGVTKFPAMAMSPEPNTLRTSTLTRSFNVYFVDLVHKDISNRQEVLSDMEQVALDYIYQMQHPSYDWVFDTSNLVLNDIVDKFDEEVSGYWVNVKFKESSPFDRCAIPQTPLSITEGACPVVTIRNSDGTVNTTVVSGGTYTLPASGGSSGIYNIYVDGVLNQTGTSADFTNETFNITA